MQSIYNFLDFRLFISPVVLFVFYYIGAFFMPYGGWLIAQKIKHKYQLLSAVDEAGKDVVQQDCPVDQNYSSQQKLTPSKRAGYILLVVVLFVFLEVIWRMMFEILMAYFQMREALILMVP